MTSESDVAIFWDFENCHPPSHLSGYEIVQGIQHVAHSFGAIKLFKAYLELLDAVPFTKSSSLRSELQASGVSLIDCPHNGRKDVADKMILVDMLAYAIDHSAPSTIILISGDRDFAYAVSILRLRRYRVVVVSPANVHASLKAQASICLDWTTDIVGGDVLEPRKAQSRDSVSQAKRRISPGGKTQSLPKLTVNGSSSDKAEPSIKGHSLPNGVSLWGTVEVLPPENMYRSMGPIPFDSVNEQTVRPPSRVAPTATALSTEPHTPKATPRNNDIPELPPSFLHLGRDLVEAGPPSFPVSEPQDVPEVPFGASPFSDTIPELHPSFDSALFSRGQDSKDSLATNLSPKPLSPNVVPLTWGTVDTPTAMSNSLNVDKVVPPNLRPLVEILELHRDNGSSRPLRSTIATELTLKDPEIYERAGIRQTKKFKNYVALAEKAGMVELGGSEASAWIALCPEWHGVLF